MPYDDADLDAWFFDFLGLGPSPRHKDRYNRMSESEKRAFRKRKASRIYAAEDRRALSNRGFVHSRARAGGLGFMNRRREKGLGSYDVDKFVVLQDDPKNGKTKFREIFARNRAELDEIAGLQKKLPQEGRDAKGRFIKK